MRVALINQGPRLDFLDTRLQAALPAAELVHWPDPGAMEAEIAVCWNPEHGTLARMRKLRLVHSIGAGVDNLMADPGLPDVPVCRIRDDDLAVAMAEYCHWSVLWFQRGFDRIVAQQAARRWDRFAQRPAADCRVGILGLGSIGQVVAKRLADLGYPVSGWSRGAKSIPGITCLHGTQGLQAVLENADVLICLLPLTPSTRGLLDQARLSQLPRGAGLVLCSRGEHLVAPDLLALIAQRQLAGAVLDVFEQEPLPADHPLWAEPRVLVTPHMAALTKPRRIAEQIAENIRRLDARLPLLNLVDRTNGY